LKGIIPKDSSVRGSSPRRKYTFSVDEKGGEIYQMQRKMLGEISKRHGSRGSDGHRGRMSDMNSVLHQGVSINAKGGDFLLIGLVFIEVDP
jgi:hypothetical protein